MVDHIYQINLYLNDFESIYDMLSDVAFYRNKGYIVCCYDENGKLIQEYKS